MTKNMVEVWLAGLEHARIMPLEQTPRKGCVLLIGETDDELVI